MQTEQQNIFGKKIFFLNPPSVFHEELIHVFIRSGYEVYSLRDHERAITLLKEYHDCLLFINIDQNSLSLDEWAQYIVQMQNNPATESVRIGVLTYNRDEDHYNMFMKRMKLPCGYIRLSLNKGDSFKIIMNAFEAAEAKGRRKHVRAQITSGQNAVFSVKKDKEIYTGQILDISEMGMACTMDQPDALSVGAQLDDFHINIRGVVCRIAGEIQIIRGTEKKIFVVIFKNISDHAKEKIYGFIFNSLQGAIDKKIKEMGLAK